MRSAKAAAPNTILRNLPSVDELLRSQSAREIIDAAGEQYLAALARKAIEILRQEIGKDAANDRSKESLLADAEDRLKSLWQAEIKTEIKKVINATGVVIHTNLGRAPLSDNARRAIADEASGYCTLEYNLETGKRGKRGGRAERMLAELTGAESVLVVNNCAAAAFFVLTVFASGGEVVISRGELVEIGGDFRVPDVLSQSGAALREVGTTNRTKLADYEKAVGVHTRMILRVHPSNYKIVGFTAMPTVAELSALAKKHKILLYEDIGSGALFDLSEFGLADEPVVSRSIEAGADVVSFSGDKLLGGPQSGIIVGRLDLIEKLRKHPLYRALRVDKLGLAALEATLEAYRRDSATSEIPVTRMLSMTESEIAERVVRFGKKLDEATGKNGNLQIEIVDGLSAVGGGAAPATQLKTKLLALSHRRMPAERLEHLLRSSDPPVIARIVDGRVMIDLRTVLEDDEAEIAASIQCLGK